MNDLASQLGHIAVIGGGRMGSAIVAGLVEGALFPPESISVANPGEKRRGYLQESFGVNCFADGSAIRHPDTVILAVKPSILREVASQLAAVPTFRPKRVISVAAGVGLATLEEIFPEISVFRVMPNVALTVGAGMSVVAVSEATASSEAELVREMFALMGAALVIPEELFDLATALSGCGLAYFALFAELLAKAGEKFGLSSEQARMLSDQSLIGTARYLHIMEASASDLRIAVTSPGGMTEAALNSFAKDNLDELLSRAVQAASNRAKELA